MTLRTRMIFSVALLAALSTTACNDKRPAPFEIEDRSPRADRDAPFDPPNMYPGWAYDAETYVKPPAPLIPEPQAKEGGPPHYFSNQKLVMIRQPIGYTPEEIPRVAIWWTDNNGFHWHKGGYFGRQQSYFPFEVEEDGDYGIRFLGPGQAPAIHTPAYPQRVYHVDTTLPEVQVAIEPEQSWYHVGQTITISWRADDYHLIEAPATISMLMDFTADESKAVELQRELADEGAITFEIPPEALDHEIRFRVEAPDRAGNLGITNSYALQIVQEPPVDDSDIDQVEPGQMDDPETVADGAGTEPWETTAEAQRDQAFEQADTVTAQSFIPDMAATTETDDLATFIGPQQSDAEPLEEAAQPTDPAEDWQPEWDQSGLSQDPSQAVDLLDEGPAAAPFATEAARRVSDDGLLSWDRPATTAFPDGNAANVQRSTDGFFDIGRAVPVDLSQDLPATYEQTESTEVGPPAADDADHRVEADNTDNGDQADITEILETMPRDPSRYPIFPPEENDLVDDPESDAARQKLEAMINGAFSVADPTRGNGLLVPLPATVEAQPVSELVTAHPWRILGDIWSSPSQTVWALPRARFGYELYRAIEGRMLADHPSLRPVADPAEVSRAIVGLPPEAAETDPTILP